MYDDTCSSCGVMFGDGGEWRPNIKCQSCDFYVCHNCWTLEDDKYDEMTYDDWFEIDWTDWLVIEKNIKGWCMGCYRIKELEKENNKLKILLIQQKCNRYILKSIYDFL